MRHGPLISTAEALTIIFPLVVRNMRMAVLVAVVNIRLAMIIEVLVSTLDAIVKSLALNITELCGRRIPLIALLTILRY